MTEEEYKSIGESLTLESFTRAKYNQLAAEKNIPNKEFYANLKKYSPNADKIILNIQQETFKLVDSIIQIINSNSPSVDEDINNIIQNAFYYELDDRKFFNRNRLNQTIKVLEREIKSTSVTEGLKNKYIKTFYNAIEIGENFTINQKLERKFIRIENGAFKNIKQELEDFMNLIDSNNYDSNLADNLYSRVSIFTRSYKEYINENPDIKITISKFRIYLKELKKLVKTKKCEEKLIRLADSYEESNDLGLLELIMMDLSVAHNSPLKVTLTKFAKSEKSKNLINYLEKINTITSKANQLSKKIENEEDLVYMLNNKIEKKEIRPDIISFISLMKENKIELNYFSYISLIKVFGITKENNIEYFAKLYNEKQIPKNIFFNKAAYYVDFTNESTYKDSLTYIGSLINHEARSVRQNLNLYAVGVCSLYDIEAKNKINTHNITRDICDYLEKKADDISSENILEFFTKKEYSGKINFNEEEFIAFRTYYSTNFKKYIKLKLREKFQKLIEEAYHNIKDLKGQISIVNNQINEDKEKNIKLINFKNNTKQIVELLTKSKTYLNSNFNDLEKINETIIATSAYLKKYSNAIKGQKIEGKINIILKRLENKKSDIFFDYILEQISFEYKENKKICYLTIVNNKLSYDNFINFIEFLQNKLTEDQNSEIVTQLLNGLEDTKNKIEFNMLNNRELSPIESNKYLLYKKLNADEINKIYIYIKNNNIKLTILSLELLINSDIIKEKENIN